MLKTIPNIWLLQLLLLASCFFGIPAANAAILKNMPSGAENLFFTNLSLPQSPKHEDSCRVPRYSSSDSALVLVQFIQFIQKDPKRDGWNWYSYTNDAVNMVEPSGMVSHAQFLGGLAGFTGGLIADAVGGSILGPVGLGMSEAALFAPFAPVFANALAKRWADFQNNNITEKALVVGSLIGGSSFGSPGSEFTKNTTKKFPTNVKHGDQGKHIRGQQSFNPKGTRSTISQSIEEIEELLKKFVGMGQPANKVEREVLGFRERVDFGEVIGEYITQDGSIRLPTTKGIIHYSKTGIHVVPATP